MRRVPAGYMASMTTTRQLLSRLYEINRHIDGLPPTGEERLRFEEVRDQIREALDHATKDGEVTAEWEAQAKHALSETEKLPIFLDTRAMPES